MYGTIRMPTYERISKRSLKKARPEDVRRFAKWLGLHDIDGMSDRQVVKLLDWYLKRREKRARGMVSSAWTW